MKHLREKAEQIVAYAEMIKERNRDKPYEKRQDYCYTSYAWATRFLKEVTNE